MNALPDWIGVILAGGRSTRMGRDKAMLDWQGAPLLAHMGRLLRRAGARRVVVSGAYPAFGGVPDLWPDLGPIGGLCSVAQQLPDGELLVVAVDMPALQPAALAALRPSQGQACSVFADYRLPMRLRLDARSRRCLQDVLRAPPQCRSLRALQQSVGTHALAAPKDASLWFANCNTVEQWQQLQRNFASGATPLPTLPTAISG
ncbi:MAG TPA: molybdenum cofactor guanylyltransferase [Stenotrophomonas sp.]|nr:molybdenum cofactor guanylyltransferase [Stenotrophomonas sp.]